MCVICAACITRSSFFFSSRRRHTRSLRDWSSDVCSSDLDDPLARGLALAAGIPARALPRDAGSMLASLADEGVALVVLDALREAQLRERRTALERDWFLPLLAALKSSRIGMLTLHLAGENQLLQVETVRSDLRYFWRLRKPLSAYA